MSLMVIYTCVSNIKKNKVLVAMINRFLHKTMINRFLDKSLDKLVV